MRTVAVATVLLKTELVSLKIRGRSDLKAATSKPDLSQAHQRLPMNSTGKSVSVISDESLRPQDKNQAFRGDLTMKKIIVSAAIIAGFAFAAFSLPGYKVVVKVTENNANACNEPGCEGGN